MKTEEIHYKVGDKNMVGFVAYPDSNNSPLVLIAHAWAGKDTFVHDRAKDLAMLGYTAMAVDMYGEGKVGADISENEALMTPLISNRRSRLLKSCCHRLLFWRLGCIGFSQSWCGR